MKGGINASDEEDFNVGLMLAEHLKELQGFDNVICISVGHLLLREITMHSNYGKLIDECRKNYEYIPDEIVIDLVKKHIAECEEEMSKAEDPSNCGWILEGFPRTRLQALALQQMKVRPNKLFMLNYPSD
jgi:adenylate kinase